ncbi:hypothetical protein [Candidatus Chlorohelix sp.]|uniref:YveK family protein n=1 Tax=Candidatus Chlorohelix sp. TaxID=3139201 RepID=UPI00304109A9
MELRKYGRILFRYWWLVLLFTIAGGALAYSQYKSTSSNYQAVFEVNVGRNDPPLDQANKGFQDYFNYYQFISSEYVLDDYVKIVKGSVFLNDAAEKLKSTKYPLSPEELKGNFDVERKHREITFTVHTETEDKALVIARALADTIVQNAGKYIAHGDSTQFSANLIDFPTSAIFNSGRNLLVSSIRLIVGLILGIGLAFLLAYLDNRLRTPEDFKEALGLPVIGVIPAKALLPFGQNNSGGSNYNPNSSEPEQISARR